MMKQYRSVFRKLRQQVCKSKTAIGIKRIYQYFLLPWLVAILIVACNHASVPETQSLTNCRTVEHVAGETCVPLSPQRLIALGPPTMADALSVGIKPIGTVFYFDETPPYLEGKLDGIELLGKIPEQPNLEKTLTLNPDVIIGVEGGAESVYSQLSQIAPTVLGRWNGYPSWKDHFNFVAEVLGKTEEAEKVWEHYEQRIQELRVALGDNYQDLEVSFVHICCGTIDIDFKNSFNGMILDDVGLRRPPAQSVVKEGGITSISEERLMDIDGDILLVAVTSGKSEEILEQLKQKPLWNKLRAVQQGRVYPVNYATWRGGNPLAADAVIDDLFKYLVER
jgi:iron complex transport system substrate-binding protein